MAGAERIRAGNYNEAQMSAGGTREMMEQEKFLEEVSLQEKHLLIIHSCISQIFIETLPYSRPWAGCCVCSWGDALAWIIHVGI